jgi:hypothetical protein
MNSKTDKEDRSCDDIVFLFEIITNFRLLQKSQISNPIKLVQIRAYHQFGLYRENLKLCLHPIYLQSNAKLYILTDETAKAMIFRSL